MTFSANARAGPSASYGQPTTLLAGAPGEVQAAALAPGRFVVLMRTANVLMSRAGGGGGFAPALRFTGTDATRLLGMDGMRGGLAAAAWLTTSGSVDAAIYDDASEPGSLPPAAGRDTTPPVLSRLSVAPRRFAVRRSAQGRRTRGTRIRWRLSEPARVVLRVDRARPGFRRGSRCQAKRPRAGRARRCTRFVRVGSFARTAPAGTTSLRFNGFVRRRALPAGPLPVDCDRHRRRAPHREGQARALHGRARLTHARRQLAPSPALAGPTALSPCGGAPCAPRGCARRRPGRRGPPPCTPSAAGGRRACCRRSPRAGRGGSRRRSRHWP